MKLGRKFLVGGSSADEYSNLSFHPYHVVLVLLLIGISVLFLAITGAMVYNRWTQGQEAILLPWAFYLSSIWLILSNYFLIKAKTAYDNDDMYVYHNRLRYVGIMSVVFLVTQTYGWYDLLYRQVWLNTSQSGAYLYLLTGLHYMHVLLGVPFFIIFFRNAGRSIEGEVQRLVYLSDPDKRLKLKLLTLYWYFLDALWLYLLVILSLVYLIWKWL